MVGYRFVFRLVIIKEKVVIFWYRYVLIGYGRVFIVC